MEISLVALCGSNVLRSMNKERTRTRHCAAITCLQCEKEKPVPNTAAESEKWLASYKTLPYHMLGGKC